MLCILKNVIINLIASYYLFGGDFLDVKVGDLLEMRKPHPCKGKFFLVLRSGMDFKLRCTTCQHEFMVKRSKIEKNIKKILRQKFDN